LQAFTNPVLYILLARSGAYSRLLRQAQTLLANYLRQGWKDLAGTNALAYLASSSVTKQNMISGIEYKHQ